MVPLAIGVHELAAMSERRIERLVNPAYSELPAFLVQDGGLNSGFMIAHCTAAALGKFFKQHVFEGKRHGVQSQNRIQGFSLHFPKEISYGYLRFEGNGKIPFGVTFSLRTFPK